MAHVTVYKEFKEVVRALGYENARSHDLRHSYAVAAIESDDALTVVDDLAAYGYVKGRPLLGVVVEAGGKPITSVADLLDARRSWHAGDTITIVAIRGDETLTFSVTLDEDLPQNGSPQDKRRPWAKAQGRRSLCAVSISRRCRS